MSMNRYTLTLLKPVPTTLDVLAHRVDMEQGAYVFKTNGGIVASYPIRHTQVTGVRKEGVLIPPNMW
jgi:hypothetical protein